MKASPLLLYRLSKIPENFITLRRRYRSRFGSRYRHHSRLRYSFADSLRTPSIEAPAAVTSSARPRRSLIIDVAIGEMAIMKLSSAHRWHVEEL